MLTSCFDFGVAGHGVRWAASLVPEGHHVTLDRFAGARGQDDYAIRFGRDGGVRVLANTPSAAISGLLELGQSVRQGDHRGGTGRPKFRTRNYKHEIALAAPGPRNIIHYTDAMMESLVQQIVRRQFNGLVLYPDDGHPFPHILDLGPMDGAADRPAAECAAIRSALNRLLAIAHRYGLTTFLQHYIGHFTRRLAERLGIKETPASGRLSGYEHPEITRYVRYCYREIFPQCPDLDGLYFNFESMPDSHHHLLQTAVPICNEMDRKPIFVFRLWNVVDVEGFKQVYDAYRGRKILFHKIADSSDMYHYPAADSRVKDWHRHIPGAEFGFCVGPCHNCGTNLSEALWADYDYVQTLVADAHAKGADSIGFHSEFELLSEDLPGGEAIFSDAERQASRSNILHLQAVVDFVNGRAMDAGQRAKLMGERLGLPARAARTCLRVIEATSQITPTVWQQFYYTYAFEGFLNPGRNGHIQDPFYFYPPNGLNKTRGLNIHTAPLGNGPWPWIQKIAPTTIAPANLFQPIIDYVNPAKARAKRHPAAMAARIRQSIRQAQSALDGLRSQGFGGLADDLAPRVRHNAALGRLADGEIRAAIELYSLYFATSRRAALRALRKGLDHLRTLAPAIADPADRKAISRMLLWDKMEPQEDADRVQDLLDTFSAADFPMNAFSLWAQSRREYNEIRRYVRPYRLHNRTTLGYARRQLAKSRAAARKALAVLSGSDATYAANVQAWLDFLDVEESHMTPPSARCSGRTADQYLGLFHDGCFRMGEHYADDFLGFFRKFDYVCPRDLAIAFWTEPDALVVACRETGCDPAARKARWQEYRASGSDLFVFQIHLQPPGADVRHIIVFPNGPRVAIGTEFVDVPARLDATGESYQFTVHLPWRILGAKAKKGHVWRANVTSNPFIMRNLAYTWAPQYDSVNPGLFGRLTFD
jgi:hypothetical protein